MKKLVLVLLLTLFAVPALAAEVVANPVGEAVASLLSGVVFPVLSALLLGLVGVVLNKAREKYNLQISAEARAQVERLALSGIAYAEERAAAAAKHHVTKITGQAKLDEAIAHLMVNAPHLNQAEAEALIHTMLGRVAGAGATGSKGIY